MRVAGVVELVAGMAGSGIKCAAFGDCVNAGVDVGSRLVEDRGSPGVVRIVLISGASDVALALDANATLRYWP